MPEEVNRLVADHVADILLAPTPGAMTNLDVEGLAAKAVLTGDVMYDAVLQARQVPTSRGTPTDLDISPGAYGVVTIHRASNTGVEVFRGLLDTLNEVAEVAPLVFPVHPRSRAVIERDLPAWRPSHRLHLIEPLGYVEMLHLVEGARWVLTDSGGLQKEAFFLDVPCVTLRRETEWVETVTAGANVLVGTEAGAIVSAVAGWEDTRRRGDIGFGALVRESYGDGRAAHKILDAVTRMTRSET